MTPSLEIGNGNWAVKSDSLLGYKTIDGKYYPREIGVTRATTATRVNAEGLVELVPYNLLSYSEEFDNAAWTKTGSTISANSITAPNGTTTADTFTPNAGQTAANVNRTISVVVSPYTFSFYAKSFGQTKISLVSNLTATYRAIVFDLANESAATATGWTASIESVGDGWYRCSATADAASASSYAFQISNNSTGWTGDGTSGVYLWGAQLVEGTEPKDYLPTTDRLDIARIDYSTGDAALLVEPQRTNLVLSSEDFTNAVYWNNSNTTDTANQAISPDGTQDADRVNGDAVNTFHRIYRTASISASTAYTFSVYVKANTLGFIQLALNNGFTSNYLFSPYANFNLATGVVSQSANGATAQIQSLTNGWYRCSITATSLAGATAGEYNINLINAGTLTAFQSWSGTTNDSVFLYGAQLEAGSYPTSYIPTTSASVTRNADVVSMTNASAYIGQTEGTMFVDIVFKNPISSVNRPISITESHWASGGSIRLDVTSTQFVVDIVNAGSSVGAITHYTSVLPNIRYKIAIAYKQNDCKMYINGVDVGSDTSTSAMPTCSELYLNALGGGFNAPYEASNINVAALYKERLSNAELTTLTTI